LHIKVNEIGSRQWPITILEDPTSEGILAHFSPQLFFGNRHWGMEHDIDTIKNLTFQRIFKMYKICS
jgi:glutaredoxin